MKREIHGCFRMYFVLKLDLGFREEEMVFGSAEGEMRQQEHFDWTQKIQVELEEPLKNVMF